MGKRLGLQIYHRVLGWSAWHGSRKLRGHGGRAGAFQQNCCFKMVTCTKFFPQSMPDLCWFAELLSPKPAMPSTSAVQKPETAEKKRALQTIGNEVLFKASKSKPMKARRGCILRRMSSQPKPIRHRIENPLLIKSFSLESNKRGKPRNYF